ncbi:MAG: hypothetical protein COT17_01055 [Elusimicrobia bacterium CG08_land_8_20_14_0_20_51_18]|nr:MAG: hypothetical protein COT17_01055 [Elusimicrobia bacterium CG08_land_8_20_14_0_20_51_18]
MTPLKNGNSTCKLIKNYLLEKNPNFKKTSKNILKIIKKDTGSPFGFAGHLEEGTGKLIIPTLTGEMCPACRMKNKTAVFDKFDNLFGWVVKNGKPLLTNRPGKDCRSAGVPKGHIRINKFLAAPAIIRGKTVGILALANKKDPYTPDDLGYLSRMANFYAMLVYHLIKMTKLEKSEKSFRELIENTRNIIYVVNKNGIIEYMNKRVQDYGYKKEEVVGHSVAEFAHPEDKIFVMKAFKKAMRTGKTANSLRYRILKKDGTFFQGDQKSSLILEKGKAIKIIGAIRDVTEQSRTQRELMENRELLDKIFNSAKDAIFVKDFKGFYVKGNKACGDIFGLKPENIPGVRDEDFCPPELAAQISENEKEVLAGKTTVTTRESVIRGKKRVYNVIRSPLKAENGEIKFILGITRDISKLRKLESELALMKAREKIKLMTSDLSHDINNTLATISGYADLISEALPGNLELEKEFKIIQKATKKAARIINSFRKKSQLGAKNKPR